MHSDLEYKKQVVVGLIITSALLFFCAGVSIYQAFLPVVTLKVNSESIRQGEEVPIFQVYAEYSGKKNKVLDNELKYTVNDLVEEWNQGNGYRLDYQVDNKAEGKYELKLTVEQSLKEKLVTKWNQKIRYRVENGILEVKNKYGDWKDKRFTFLDGTVASGWTNIGNDTYYFDEEGEYVSGIQEINGNTYYFSKKGIFDEEKNKVNPGRPMIAITFDDGPGAYTMQLLEQLEKYDARATFFMVGTNVSKYPDAIKKMDEIGCELGNHTMHHARLTELTPEGIVQEIQGINVQVSNIVGKTPTLVRPPYGSVNETVQMKAGAPLAMWSVDTRDWELKNAAVVRDYVLNTVKDGDIVLLHDIHETTVQAMVEAIPKLIEKGYQLVTVTEMAKARGLTMEHGVKYYHFYK